MMQVLLDRMTQRVRSLITRGRVVSAALNPKRPLIQLSGLAGETKTDIELFMPMGMSVYPTGKEDVVLLQVTGSRSHLVALFADNPALRIQDLQPGEFGHRDTNGQQIVFRKDHIEITTTKNVVGHAALWDLTGDVKVKGNITASGDIADKTRSMQGDRDIYNDHKHGGVDTGSGTSAKPDQSQ